MPRSTRDIFASTLEHLVSLNLKKIQVHRFPKKLNSTFPKFLCVHLHSIFSGLYRLYSTTRRRCLTGTRAGSVGSDGHCHVPPSFPYPAEKGFRVSPFTTVYSLPMTLSACYPVKFSELLPPGAFVMISTYWARR